MTAEQALRDYRAVCKEMEILLGKSMVVVSDTVKGSSSDWPYIEQAVTVEGVNATESDRVRRRIEELRRKREAAERIIEQAPNSKTRIPMELYYMRGLKWHQVAAIMGGDESVDSVRKRVERYLKGRKVK